MLSNRAMIGEPDAGWRGEQRRERERLEVFIYLLTQSVRLLM
jgi:hypothetical protein